MAIFNEGRLRLRADLVQQLKALDPVIAHAEDVLGALYRRYNDLLDVGRGLQDALLDDLEAAQERGAGAGAVDYAHYFWSRLDLVDLPGLERRRREDAERLEALPGDA